MGSDFKKLDYTEVFSSLPQDELRNLKDEAIERTLKKGQIICHQDDVWPFVIHVVSGQLRWAMLATSGKEHILFHLNAGENFWAHSIFDDQPMPAYLTATQKSTVLLWPREVILGYLLRYPDAMWQVTGILTRTMRQAREIIYNLAFKPTAGRIATLLLDQSAPDGSSQIDRTFTLNDLASSVAASPEVVCRLLYQFQEDGVLEVTRASIHIRDREALVRAKEF
ncbi:Crp/Fnr family transcriptional regulator [bacterium]|nr:Crp/Fnr family transcriptional regulator [bacterium]